MEENLKINNDHIKIFNNIRQIIVEKYRLLIINKIQEEISVKTIEACITWPLGDPGPVSQVCASSLSCGLYARIGP